MIGLNYTSNLWESKVFLHYTTLGLQSCPTHLCTPSGFIRYNVARAKLCVNCLKKGKRIPYKTSEATLFVAKRLYFIEEFREKG